MAGVRPRAGREGGGQRASGRSPEAIARRFFDFFRDVPRGLLCFEATSGQVRRGAGSLFSLKSLRARPAILSFNLYKLVFCAKRCDNSQGPKLFALAAAPRSISKNMILHGAVIKNSDGIICLAYFGNRFPSKVTEFNGRAAKS